jgi:hypothetical protein
LACWSKAVAFRIICCNASIEKKRFGGIDILYPPPKLEAIDNGGRALPAVRLHQQFPLVVKCLPKKGIGECVFADRRTELAFA